MVADDAGLSDDAFSWIIQLSDARQQDLDLMRSLSKRR